MKIALIGHPGSGKTYLAKKLSGITGIERVDIDTLFDRHPFYFLSKTLYRKKLKEMFLGKNTWIIDGYHGRRMPDWIWETADVVIFLDLPKEHLKENVLSRHKDVKTKEEFSHWQATKANNLKNLGQIAFFDRSLRKNSKRIARLAKNSEFIVLQSREQVDDFLQTFDYSR